MARETAEVLEKYLIPRSATPGDEPRSMPVEAAPTMADFPGVTQALPDPRWCAQNEGCATLADYLRRRTNLSQWVPRLGLGANDEHVERIGEIARTIRGSHMDPVAACREATEDLLRLRQAAEQQDQLLGAV